MTLLNKILEYKKKTVTRRELADYLNCFSEEELYCEIQKCVTAGILIPVISAKTNGNIAFPIYDKYRVILPDKDYSECLSAIKVLHPLLIKNGYLKNKPEIYEKYKSSIDCLNSWFFSELEETVIKVSRKERSFEIFSEEKALDNKTFWQLLNNLGIDETTLNFYDTPEYCFNDYIPIKKEKLNLIICENKDIWFNLRKLMFEENINLVAGLHFDGVIYGNGNKISNKAALTEYTRFLGYDFDSVKYFYWGDIDREGFEIYNRVVKENQKVNISLFVEAYKLMIDLSENRQIPDSGDNREHYLDFNSIYKLFDKDYSLKLQEFIKANKCLPQEIVSYAQLKKVTKKYE